MPRTNTSKQTKLLYTALVDSGLDAVLEKWDGHKHIDISIPSAKLYIEVDGGRHYTDPEKIEADLIRDNYSVKDGFDTFRVPNDIIDNNLNKVLKALLKVIKDREL